MIVVTLRTEQARRLFFRDRSMMRARFGRSSARALLVPEIDTPTMLMVSSDCGNHKSPATFSSLYVRDRSAGSAI